MKKLIVLLVILALSMPAMAAYIGQDENGDPTTGNPLKVDNTLAGNAQTPKSGWQDWDITRDWTGPIGTDLYNPNAVDPWEVPHVELDAYRTGQTPNNTGGARDRNGGMAFVAGTGEFNATAKMFGMNYLKLTITNLAPDTQYNVRLWSYEATNVWSVNSNNPNSKFGVWSTLNPVAWLTSNGYPNGYAPTELTDGSSGMPCAMKTAAYAEGGRETLMAPVSDGGNYVETDLYCVEFYATTTSGGALTLYGWIDPTDWAGSMHMPIHGFQITPEPTTIALLGLGGLALLRRKKA